MKLKGEYESNIKKLNEIIEKEGTQIKSLEKQILSLELEKKKYEEDLE